ncbi:MAG: phosphoribosylanthranilate isomerase [Treponema sp.]|nr:phosphoribosylanthranilate isomerase [Treponema sp.]
MRNEKREEDMIRVKICGLTQQGDIEVVNVERPDYVGFVFAASRRRVTARQAVALRRGLNAGIIPVGVFVDETIENILSLVHDGVIAMVQLHGSENEEYIQKLKRLTDKPVVKAISVQEKGDVQKWTETAADYLLLDHKGGGTGHHFDWDLIGETSKPYFLAGGLHAENIGEAIMKTAPFAVDVSSGVETDGMKDPAKITQFIRMVRNEH